MKRETARLLRAVLRLIEDDLREVADSVVEIDQREAAHYQNMWRWSNRAASENTDLCRRLDALEHRLGLEKPGAYSVKA